MGKTEVIETAVTKVAPKIGILLLGCSDGACGGSFGGNDNFGFEEKFTT